MRIVGRRKKGAERVRRGRVPRRRRRVELADPAADADLVEPPPRGGDEAALVERGGGGGDRSGGREGTGGGRGA